MKINKMLFSALALVSSLALADDRSQYQQESRALALPFMKQLAAANQQAVSEGGPESAIKVCREIAPKMAGDLSRQTGWKLSRVSLKVRNPLLGAADAWEQQKLQEFEGRVAQGEKPDAMEVAEIVQEPAGRYFRYLKPIVLQTSCVTCHGNSDAIPADVKVRLQEDYPHDKATGYMPGQIRGAVSIKRAL